MSRFKIILSAGVCAVALNGCVTAAAGLALTAASLVTGDGGSGGQGFSNPIDRQSTGRQVREALSQLDETVDPACQTQLDEYQNTHGTLAVGAPIKRQSTSPALAQTAPAAKPPVDLLAKVHAETGGDDDSDASTPAAAEESSPADDPTTTAAAEVQPVKASLDQDTSSGPGHCENRFVCLPGTPKPTIMLMCPGKKNQQTTPDTTVASGSAAPVSADDAAPVDGDKRGSQETAAIAPDSTANDETPAPARAAAEADDPAGAPSKPSDAATPVQASVSGPTPPEAPARTTIERGGVADWNWSFDPSKQL